MAAEERPQRPGEPNHAQVEAEALGVTIVHDGQVPPDAAEGSRPVVVNVEQRRMGRGLTAFIVVVVSLVLLCFMGCSAAMTAMFGGIASLAAPATTTVASGPQIAVFHLNQTLGATSGITPELMRSVIARVENDPSIVALVVRSDCPGGEAAASEEIAGYIAGCSKPVVFSVGGNCSSGAYMAASQADWIVAGPMSNVGSIGVIISAYDLQGLYEKLGIDVEVIKSADAKDAGAAYRSMTDEERAGFQREVDQINDMFIAMVAQGRNEDIETVEEWATGLSYLGVNALEMGLIDELGSYDDALDRAAELAGVSQGRYSVLSVDPAYGSGLDVLELLLGL